ncbi:type II secretion system protein GspD [Betaproteobacteria bacterium GR16-43]|nr:type II secretion system protein GspD [Betaproteobacteria bacterium GR16-43]
MWCVIAAGALSMLGGCSMYPGGLKFPESTVAGVPDSQKGDFGPNRPASPPQSAANSAASSAAPPVESKVYPGTGVFVNPKPVPPGPAAAPEEASLNFEGLDVREVAKVILGDYLKESYTVHPSVTGNVTFRTIKPISKKDLLPTLEMLLRQNNAAVVREEGVYKILPIASVRGSVSPQLGSTTAPLPPGFSVIVVPLKFVGGKEMQKLLEPFAADNTVRVDDVRNLVILAGHQRELRHLLDTIELFDVDWLAGYSIGLFPIKSADVKTLVADLDKIFGPTGQGPLSGIVRVIPIERLNALLLVTTQPRYLEMAKTWVDRLDQMGGTSGGSRFFVYYVKNGKAENLAQLVGDLFSSRRASSAPSLAPGSRPAEIRSSAPTLGGMTAQQAPATAASSAPASATFQLSSGVGSTASEVRVIADKDTNSLLILSTQSDYEVIESALRKLDVIPRQVLVEVFLAEVSLTDDLKFGIEWFINGRSNSSTTGQINLGGLPPLTSAGVPPGVPVPISPPVFQLVSLSGTAVRAVLNSLGQDGRSQVLASPQIMVLDNQKAQIKVGDRISVQTSQQSGVSTGTGVLSQFQYIETGILLTVTPRINSGGQVTLDINQEVSVADPNTGNTAANPNPNVNSRSAQTTVVVASGDSIVLGGLIREDNLRTSAGVPLLSKIPILGAAFGSQSIKRRRTELVLIVTPKIISDAAQAREATDELRKRLPALEGFLPKRDGTPPGTSPRNP